MFVLFINIQFFLNEFNLCVKLKKRKPPSRHMRVRRFRVPDLNLEITKSAQPARNPRNGGIAGGLTRA